MLRILRVDGTPATSTANLDFLANGTPTSPSLAFRAEPTTGVYLLPETKTLGVAAEGGLVVSGNIQAAEGGYVLGDGSLLTGTISQDRLPQIIGNASTQFVGNGFGLSSTNAANISGTISQDRLPQILGNSLTQFVGNGALLTGIVSGPDPPAITSVQITDSNWVPLDDTALDTETGGHFVVTGSGFAPGIMALIGSVNAPSTSYANSTTLRVTAPIKASGSYDLTIVRGDSATATLPSAVTYSEGITWITGSNLGNVTEGIAFTIPIEAISDSLVTYSNTSPLPPQTALDAVTGNLEGNITTVESDTVFSFDIRATDLEFQSDTRTFLLHYLLAFAVIQIAAGHEYTLALVRTTGGGVLIGSWGRNNTGQIGDGTSGTNRLSPVNISSSGTLSGRTVVVIAAGFAHTLALCSDNTVHAWGSNNSGQIGDGTSGTNLLSPVNITNSGTLSGKTVVAIAAGREHTLALCSDNTVHAWGRNSEGQIGDGTSGSTRRSPVNITNSGTLSGKTVVAIAAGGFHTLALCSDNTVHAWGGNSSGQIGDGTSGTNRLSPVNITTSGTLSGKTVVAIAAGQYHTLARCSDNTVHAWGWNGYGQIGDGTGTNERTSPVNISSSGTLSGRTVVAIAAGDLHTLARCSDNTVHAWGYNLYGQIGDGTSGTNRLSPVNITTSGTLSGKTVVAIAAGYWHNLARCSDNTVHAWGRNDFGQIGDGTSGTNRTIPVNITQSLKNGLL
jgi:alpha-tubulin suppressor-like RCC1 family protein